MKKIDKINPAVLTADPILKHMSPRTLSRMFIHVKRKELKKGELLYRENESGDNVFLIESGEFAFLQKGSTDQIERRQSQTRTRGYLGVEILFGSEEYQDSLMACDDASVIVLPAADIEETIRTSDDIKAMLFDAYSERYHDFTPEAPGPAEKPSKTGKGYWKESVGWLLSVVLPILCYQIMIKFGFSLNASYFVTIITAAVTMWVFELVPAFVPPLFGVLTAILLDVVPPEIAVSGFASETFFMLLSIFAIGVLMSVSGFTYRLSLSIMRIVPPTPFWYNISIFLSGVLLTPVIPSQVSRTVIIAPFLTDLTGISNPGEKDPLATMFYNSALAGICLTTTIFLTGKPTNLIVFGLFDSQTQFAYQWLHWLIAASFAGLVMVSLFLALLYWTIVRNRLGRRRFSIPKDLITKQLELLGPMTTIEWGALISIAILILGVLTTAFHKIEIPWMSLSILVTLLIFGGIGKDEIRSKVDWTTLIFIGTIIAWLPIMSVTGLDRMISENLGWMGEYMKTNLPLFIGILCVLIVIVRLALPEPITVIIFATAMLPISNTVGITPWLCGFIILTMSETIVFIYQMPYSIQLKDELDFNKLGYSYDEKQIVKFNIAMIAIRAIAIFASIPFWRYIDLI